MNWYCEKCKCLHSDDSMCPQIQKSLKTTPSLLSEAANFTAIAGEYALVSSNALNTVAKGINTLVGTDFAFEGAHQVARDIQVFKRLSEEPFKRAGYFASPEKAKAYFETVESMQKHLLEQGITDGRKLPLNILDRKLTGYSQEVDWLRLRQGKLSSIIEKNSLLSGNAAGVDGETINRFTGKTISRTTVKASQNTMTKNSTAINDVKEAISKGTATEKDIIFGPKGTAEAAKQAGLKNPVVEKNTPQQIKDSNARLKHKMATGQATTSVTLKQASQQMAQGAVIGAAVGLTVSTITSYIRYKNGEITLEEAFSQASEDTLKSAISGGILAGTALFIPVGAIGFVAGIGIGIYVNAVCTNVLDEIYGKGAYGAILDASGYVYGTTMNLGEYLDKIEKNVKKTNQTIYQARQLQAQTDIEFDLFEKQKGE